jgi:hypothetical protein
MSEPAPVDRDGALIGFVVRSLFGERIGVVVGCDSSVVVLQGGRVGRRRYAVPRRLTLVRAADRVVLLLAELDELARVS